MNDAIRRCKHCGIIFNSFGNEFCADCEEDLDRIFNLVQDYIFDHGNASVPEIAKALDVDGKIILGFIKDGSLALQEGSYALSCERCGKAIATGRYCSDCMNNISSSLGQAAAAAAKKFEKDEEKKKTARMHMRYKD